MNRLQEQLLEFHRVFDCAIGEMPHIPESYAGASVMDLRFALIEEEYDEFKSAIIANDLVGAVDGLMDLLYVVVGTAVSMGIDIETFFDEVHRSNMSKVWPDGTVHYRENDRKVIKPDTYSPADIAGLLKQITAS